MVGRITWQCAVRHIHEPPVGVHRHPFAREWLKRDCLFVQCGCLHCGLLSLVITITITACSCEHVQRTCAFATHAPAYGAHEPVVWGHLDVTERFFAGNVVFVQLVALAELRDLSDRAVAGAKVLGVQPLIQRARVVHIAEHKHRHPTAGAAHEAGERAHGRFVLVGSVGALVFGHPRHVHVEHRRHFGVRDQKPSSAGVGTMGALWEQQVPRHQRDEPRRESVHLRGVVWCNDARLVYVRRGGRVQVHVGQVAARHAAVTRVRRRRRPYPYACEQLVQQRTVHLLQTHGVRNASLHVLQVGFEVAQQHVVPCAIVHEARAYVNLRLAPMRQVVV